MDSVSSGLQRSRCARTIDISSVIDELQSFVYRSSPNLSPLLITALIFPPHGEVPGYPGVLKTRHAQCAGRASPIGTEPQLRWQH